MARLPRLTLPGHLHHILQRGNNRQPIFAQAADPAVLLGLLDEQARSLQVAIHAYALLDNQFHLLATPGTADGIPKLMQAVGRRYVRHFNQAQARSGTLWEGRYRSTVLEPERYLLPCMVYLDLSPIWAGLVSDPADHAGSSHRHYAGKTVDRVVTPHPLYWRLGNTPFARDAAYVALVARGIEAPLRATLDQAMTGGWALGSEAFVAALQKRVERRVVTAKPGRPPKTSLDNVSPI